jgi:hypothetical protein
MSPVPLVPMRHDVVDPVVAAVEVARPCTSLQGVFTGSRIVSFRSRLGRV